MRPSFITAMLLSSVMLMATTLAQEGWNRDWVADSNSTTGMTIVFDRDVRYTVAVKVTAGPNLDVAVFTLEEYDNLKEERPAVHIQGCAVLDTADGSFSCDLDAGKYKLVFDNTDWGAAQHDGNATTFDFKLSEFYIGGGGGGGGDDDDTTTFLWVTIVIVIIVVVVIAAVLMRRRGGPQPVQIPPG